MNELTALLFILCGMAISALLIKGATFWKSYIYFIGYTIHNEGEFAGTGTILVKTSVQVKEDRDLDFLKKRIAKDFDGNVSISIRTVTFLGSVYE